MNRLRTNHLVVGGLGFLGGVLCLTVVSLTSHERVSAEPSSFSQEPASTNLGWLQGSTEERFAQIERQLRGLDVAMAEIGYRYAELLAAAQNQNWDHAQYQTEKIDLALRLALERRPKRAESSQPFLNTDLPRVLTAIENQDGEQLKHALESLHESCVECHKNEEVLYFSDSVERIRDRAIGSGG